MAPLFAKHPIDGAIPDAQKDRSRNTSAEDAIGNGSLPVGKSVLGIERCLMRYLLRTIGSPALTVALWDGQEIHGGSEPSIARLRIKNRAAYWKLVADPFFQFGEGYSAGTIDVDGDLVDFLVALFRSLDQVDTCSFYAGSFGRWLRIPYRRSLSGPAKNVHHHYDIGNDFYQLWLDQQMLYTCAYFARSDFTLEEAQVAKMEHVCRKLRLAPGETVIEAGSGWGALSLHMARHYGVNVKAYNLSHEQNLYARQQASKEGLANRVEFIEDDWRNMTGRCDAFVSIGMLEHVGRKNYRRFGQLISQCLEPKGRGLIHSIGQNQPRPFDPWIQRRIFPGAYPPSVCEMFDLFESQDFTVLDLENLRPHYAETIRHWLVRFEQAQHQVRKMFDDRFVRMWRLYLAGSIATFLAGGLQLFQVVFAKERDGWIQRTREYIYPKPRDSAESNGWTSRARV